MARQSREIIEQAYKKIYKSGLSDVTLTKADDQIINSALDEVRLYQDRFPHEESLTDEEVVNKREMNSDAASGDASDLVRYFRSLGIEQRGIWSTDWELIFALHRDFVNRTTALSKDQAELLWYGKKEEEPAPVLVEEQKAAATPEPAEEPVKAAPASKMMFGDEEDDEVGIPAYHRNNTTNTKLKEEETMANDMNIGDMMSPASSAVQDAQNMAQAFGGSASMNISGTNLGAVTETTVSAEEKALAKRFTADSKARRTAWNNEHKASYMVLGNYPLSRRIKPGVTMGTIKNPDRQLKNIISKVWEGEVMPTNMIDGMVDGVVQIPQSVAACNSGAEYTKVIKTLVEARDGGNNMIEVNLNGKPGNFKGVVVTTPNGEESWTMADAKKQIIENANAKLQFNGLAGSTQLQIKVPTSKQLAKKKKQKAQMTVEDCTQLTFAGRDAIIDMKTGEIKDPARVKVYNEVNSDVTKAAVNDRYPATSVLGFKYFKKPSVDSDSSKGKQMTKKISLAVEMLAVIPSAEPVMQKFSPKASVGQAALPYSPEEESSVLENMYVAAFANLSTTGIAELDQQRAQLKADSNSANAAAAMEAISGNM